MDTDRDDNNTGSYNYSPLYHPSKWIGKTNLRKILDTNNEYRTNSNFKTQVTHNWINLKIYTYILQTINKIFHFPFLYVNIIASVSDLVGSQIILIL